MEPHGALPGPARIADAIWTILQFIVTGVTELFF
jgi:hypothetical protein